MTTVDKINCNFDAHLDAAMTLFESRHGIIALDKCIWVKKKGLKPSFWGRRRCCIFDNNTILFSEIGIYKSTQDALSGIKMY